MKYFERNYAKLVDKILMHGDKRGGRNGQTIALFGESLTFDMSDSDAFPLLLGRKIFYQGVLGELAAMLRGPKCVGDFEKFGCNYWDSWAKKDGSLNIDYGNLWFDWNGHNQALNLIEKLTLNPTDRRMLINTWKPDTIHELDLPCCHYSYQWFVREKKYLDMVWTQRSCDTMIGLPSDAILAATWNIIIANQVGLQPGRIKMDLGDTHIYEEHIEKAKKYVTNVAYHVGARVPPMFRFKAKKGMPMQEFTPDMLFITRYDPIEVIKFELKE